MNFIGFIYMLCPGFKKAVIPVKTMLACNPCSRKHAATMGVKGCNREGILNKAMELYDRGARA
jgi:hypothetical protein